MRLDSTPFFFLACTDVMDASSATVRARPDGRSGTNSSSSFFPAANPRASAAPDTRTRRIRPRLALESILGVPGLALL